jgi:uncharacterized repeat protein (TIGR01451 family)
MCKATRQAARQARRAPIESTFRAEEEAMIRPFTRLAWTATCVAFAAGCTAWGASAAPAFAAQLGPGLEATVRALPTNLPPGGEGIIRINVYNIGADPFTAAVTATDALPAGVTFVGSPGGECTADATEVVTCVLQPEGTSEFVELYRRLEFKVKTASGISGSWDNQVIVAGGGSPSPAVASDHVAFSSASPPYGFSNVDGWFSNPNGTIDTQAGSHPFAFTFAFDMNSALNHKDPTQLGSAGGQERDIVVDLPPGVAGDPNAVPQCTRQQFDDEACPTSTQVGSDQFVIGSFGNYKYGIELNLAVYNMVPPAGVAAQFAFNVSGDQVFLDSRVHTDSNYGVFTTSDNLPQRETLSNTVTIWGVPANPLHDAERNCGHARTECASGAQPKPLLTLPTACEGPQTITAETTNWEGTSTATASVLIHNPGGEPVGFTGCGTLGFGPSIAVAPDTSAADTPAGLSVELKTPQEGLENQEGLSTSDIENTTVALPPGIAINPGQAAGLAACQASEDAIGTQEAPTCPNASKVGTVQIQSPLLRDDLEGNVYILQSNPPDLKLLIAASGDGVNLKVVGNVHLDALTGQLVTTFEKTPELPFTRFKLSFSGGAQAALATPAKCGTYSTASDFTPWGSPFIGDLFPASDFVIDTGTGGAPCPPSPLPYTPHMIAGATTDQAGGYTDFSLLLQAPDDQQRTSRLQFQTPEGLLGMISKVTLCSNGQAEANACPSTSQIGHTTVASGPGPYPLVIPEPGQPPAPIYLTEGYEGAPYGLSIVVPLHVGPFTLPTQRVRAKIEVDPLSAQLTVTTDPLPQVVAGVPTDLRSIDAVIDKPGFMFNPTGCSSRAFNGTAFGSEGAQAPIETHFQMGSCRALTFKPNFKASASGKTSRANGASLGVKLVYPTGPLGANQASSQSNIRLVKVELPKRLPSRLTTLQKACTAAQFDANPAGCPAASVVGHAKAVTPVLPVPLSGPAYFVSNGNESFPNLIIVLQGYGVTVHLVGDTFISKQGITSSTFKQVPDVPIASFELNLPEGPYSALAANGNLCNKQLQMPTEFIAQNGAELHQKTKIQVTGCPRAKRTAHPKKPRKAAHGGKGRADARGRAHAKRSKG